MKLPSFEEMLSRPPTPEEYAELLKWKARMDGLKPDPSWTTEQLEAARAKALAISIGWYRS